MIIQPRSGGHSFVCVSAELSGEINTKWGSRLSHCLTVSHITAPTVINDIHFVTYVRNSTQNESVLST